VENAGLRDRIDAELIAFLEARGQHLAEVGPEAEPVAQTLIEFLRSGGKRLRPVLCYWGWRGAGGADEPAIIITAAASLELLHAFALVHDDIMDSSETRRGQPTVHRQFTTLHTRARWCGDAGLFGVGAGILVGDLCPMLSEAMFHQYGFPLHTLRATLDLLTVMRVELAGGQYLDLVGQAQRGFSITAATRIIRYKTAKYTVERPLQIGGTLAGAQPALLAAYSEFGLPLGEAFQLRDDLLGAFGDQTTTGKSVTDDFREGKPTWLIATAWHHADPAQRRRSGGTTGDYHRYRGPRQGRTPHHHPHRTGPTRLAHRTTDTRCPRRVTRAGPRRHHPDGVTHDHAREPSAARLTAWVLPGPEPRGGDGLGTCGALVPVRKKIVHNRHVAQTLTERGSIFVDSTDEVHECTLVVFSARRVPKRAVTHATGRRHAPTPASLSRPSETRYSTGPLVQRDPPQPVFSTTHFPRTTKGVSAVNMVKHKETRFTGWIGVSIPVVCMLSLPLTGSLAKPFPHWSDSTEDVMRWASENQAFGWVQILVTTIGLALLLRFTAGLCEYLSTPGQSNVLPATIFLSAAIGIASFSVANALWIPLLAMGMHRYPSSEPLVRMVLYGSAGIMFLTCTFFALELLCIGIMIYRTKALARWIGHSAMFLAGYQLVLSMLIPTSFVQEGPLSPFSWFSLSPYMLFFVWVTVVGIALLRVPNPGRVVSSEELSG
jgi:geranylgeranyl diphosphate synthase, type I